MSIEAEANHCRSNEVDQEETASLDDVQLLHEASVLDRLKAAEEDILRALERSRVPATDYDTASCNLVPIQVFLRFKMATRIRADKFLVIEVQRLQDQVRQKMVLSLQGVRTTDEIEREEAVKRFELWTGEVDQRALMADLQQRDHHVTILVSRGKQRKRLLRHVFNKTLVPSLPYEPTRDYSTVNFQRLPSNIHGATSSLMATSGDNSEVGALADLGEVSQVDEEGNGRRRTQVYGLDQHLLGISSGEHVEGGGGPLENSNEKHSSSVPLLCVEGADGNGVRPMDEQRASTRRTQKGASPSRSPGRSRSPAKLVNVLDMSDVAVQLSANQLSPQVRRELGMRTFNVDCRGEITGKESDSDDDESATAAVTSARSPGGSQRPAATGSKAPTPMHDVRQDQQDASALSGRIRPNTAPKPSNPYLKNRYPLSASVARRRGAANERPNSPKRRPTTAAAVGGTSGLFAFKRLKEQTAVKHGASYATLLAELQRVAAGDQPAVEALRSGHMLVTKSGLDLNMREGLRKKNPPAAHGGMIDASQKVESKGKKPDRAKCRESATIMPSYSNYGRGRIIRTPDLSLVPSRVMRP